MAHTTPCVLLVSPGILKWTDMDFGLPHLVSIGGYLLHEIGESRIRVELLDLNYEGSDHEHLKRTLESFAPFVCIGLSCYSSFDYMRVMTLGRFIKRLYPDVPIVSGGYHASALPNDLIFDGSPFDAVLRGESEASMTAVVETLLGGGRIEEPIVARHIIQEMDSLPFYRWDLLKRYWPRAHDIGRKMQIYLSRGCPYRCTFCMERAKSGYQWRSYSSERAIEELRRLREWTDLGRWVINLADPLFGWKRKWRREVLEGILRHELFPRQYWTLTRSDDLDEVDVEMMARARFSIGIGLESGSPEMLRKMQKGNTPKKYLAAQERLAGLSRKYGLNWAANIIVGHPGETPETLEETYQFVRKVFTTAQSTCGWVSIDPFRLYPGSYVHEAMDQYEAQEGARFYHKTWWKSWYDGPFCAQHVDPSHSLDYETRVRMMYDRYGPLMQDIIARFKGQGRSVDRVFARSLSEQAQQMSPERRDQLLRHAQRARARRPSPRPPTTAGTVVSFPIGLHMKNPAVRIREEAVRHLLETGVLRTEAVVEALLKVPAEDYLGVDEARAMFNGLSPEVVEGKTPPWVPFWSLAVGLEALGVCAGDQMADLAAANGYVASILAELVGEEGQIVALHPGGLLSTTKLRVRLAQYNQVKVKSGNALDANLNGEWEGLWLGAALPRCPSWVKTRLVAPEGRLVTFIGPRFRPQDLVCLTHRDDELHERILGRARVGVLAGRGGWVTG